MTMKRWPTRAAAMALCALMGTAGVAQAALVSLGDGTVKDTNTNLIWLQDWNVNGLADWNSQMAWADNLSFAGSSDWALPSLDEFQALFDAYGNVSQVAEFSNMPPSYSVFWSRTEFMGGGVYFSAHSGYDGDAGKGFSFNAVAVRMAGPDVDPGGTVPEPQTLALALLALGATAAARRRRPRDDQASRSPDPLCQTPGPCPMPRR